MTNPYHYLYIMKSDGLYKIGITNNVRGRLKTIRGASASPVFAQVAWRHPDRRRIAQLERELHCHFADYHSHGEWFHLGRAASEEHGVNFRRMDIGDQDEAVHELIDEICREKWRGAQ